MTPSRLLPVLSLSLLCSASFQAVADTVLIQRSYATPMSSAPEQTLHESSQRIDTVTAKALEAIYQGEFNSARTLLSPLVTDYPNFHLGQLLLAELHAAETGLPSQLTSATFSREKMQLLLEAASRQRSRDALQQAEANLSYTPSNLLKLGSGLEHWIQVDLDRGTQTVFSIAEGKFKTLWTQYIGFGSGGFDKFQEGDLKTPLGVYRIDGYRNDQSLPELYGSGALTLDFPNLADRYDNRTGYGIWLHGVPRHSQSRGPWSSEGCVTMGNDYLDALHATVDTNKTLVALSANQLVNETTKARDLEQLHSAWQAWQTSADKLDINPLAQTPWSSITVVASGAGQIKGEAQFVTLYVPQPDEPLKALFWKRTEPNSDEWELIGDEILGQGIG